MDFWILLGVISSISSIVGWLLPIQSSQLRLVHALYGFLITVITVVAVWYWQQNVRMHSVERAATVLIAQFERDYTPEGFVYASLAFLEKNKDLYPDAYARAQDLVDRCECTGASGSSSVVSLSFSMQGLLRGIGTLEGGK